MLMVTGKSPLASLMDELYRAIADPTRRAILDELVDRNGQTLFELCGRLIMKHGIESSRQAISQHLEVLEAAGLISTERDGRYKFHWFHGEPLREITKRWPTKKTRQNKQRKRNDT
jgi:DNA-binding transcriptional ArsR family regulator